ncbi:MAG: TolC family protein [Bacteroides sp.]|nr:TolC family protein [Bacteroides sp.]
MNNPRLLTGLLVAVLSSGGVCTRGSSPTVFTLDEIFEIAETNSTQLRPSLTAVDEAEKEIKVAENGRLPEINASLNFSYIGDGFTTKRDFSDYQKAPIPHFGSGIGINVTQPVYAGGAIENSIKMAKLKSTAARYAAEFKRDNIRFQLTGFYLDLYKYSNLRQVVTQNISQARKVLAEMTARYEQGTALRNDITRYELLVSNLELQLIKINNMIDILNRNLVVTAGLPDETVVLPDSTMLARALPDNSGEGWWQSEAEVNSPAIKLAESGRDICLTAESLVKADRRPKIGLQAGWTLDGPILVEVPPINRNLSYWHVGVGISYNLSSIFKTDKTVAKSKISTRKATENLEATHEDVSLAVRNDYVHFIEAYEELKTQTKSVELAERNYATTSARYSADMALITDMLDAANSKLDAEQCLVNARIDIIYYYYKLLFTSGKI